MSGRWWDGGGTDVLRRSMSMTGLGGVYEGASLVMLADALENSTPVFRTSMERSGCLCGNVTGSFVRSGGRLLLCDDDMDDPAIGYLYAWDSAIAILTYDGTSTKVELSCAGKDRFVRLRAVLSGALG